MYELILILWLQVGQQGTITSVRKDVVLYVTLDVSQALLQVTTVMTAAATLFGVSHGKF